MATKQLTIPNPRRVAAGRLNQQKRKGLSPAGRERLRQSALQNQPWLFSTGPRTAAGKAKSILNGKLRQLGPRSVREIQRDLAGLRKLVSEMGAARATVGGIVNSRTSYATRYALP